MKPTALSVRPDGIPAALKVERRWVTWSYVWREKEGRAGRWSKLPSPAADAATRWLNFDSALDRYRRYRRFKLDGIGFCLLDGWGGLDLDHVRDDHAAIERLRVLGVYLERSPSGDGFKAFGRARRVGGQVDFATGSFTAWTRARFFAVTGHGEGDPTVDLTPIIDQWFPASSLPHFVLAERLAFDPHDTRGTECLGPGDVHQPRTDAEVVALVLDSPQADKFIALVRGDLSAYGGDQSRADQALLCILAYWTNRNVEQMDRMFRQTKLMRPKWNVESYRRASLAKAVQL